MHHHRFLLHCLALLALLFVATPAASSKTTRSPRGTLYITEARNITYVTISNPPINLYDSALSSDLYNFLASLNPANRTTPPPKVVVFRSSDPDFFIAHLNLNTNGAAAIAEVEATSKQYAAVAGLLQNLTTTVFIGEVNGRAFEAGNELLVQMDMRFAGPKTRVGALETSIGAIPADGGIQFLARLTNKGRAMQYLLAGDTADCKTVNELGWFNDCLGSQKELETTVKALAKRIARRPAGALTAIKARLAAVNPSKSDLDGDLAAIAPLDVSPETAALTKKFVELSENQTRSDFELGLDDALAELFQ